MSISQFPVPSSGGVSLFSRSTVFTSSGTFTHPDGPTSLNPATVLVIAVGGGGGGGAGGKAIGTSGNAQSAGGGGGGPGGVWHGYIPCVGALGITVGSGGAGAPATAHASQGGFAFTGPSGTAGGISIVDNGAGRKIVGIGGGAGGGGTANAYDPPATAQTGAGGVAGLSNFANTTVTGGGAGGSLYSPSVSGRFPSGSMLGLGATGGAGGGGIYNTQTRASATVTDFGYNTYLLGIGGSGGTGAYASNANATSSPGSNATGNSAGGGGSGGIALHSVNSSTTRTMFVGKGGDGTAGLVYLFY